MTSYTLIVNARSDASRSEKIIRESEELIHRKLSKCEIIYVYEPEKLVSISSEAARKSTIVIACGGDGTMQSVARGLVNSKALLGVIPLGSGNDFAKSVGIPLGREISFYVDLILQKNILHVDLPTINSQPFLNTVGIGFDGLTNFYASNFTMLTGMAKYTAAGIKAFLTARSFSISGKVDNKPLDKKVWLLAFANGAIEGGKYHISPESVNTDGRLELIIVPAYSRLKLAVAFICLSLGKDLSNSFSERISFKKASIMTSENHFIHLDGEVGIPSKSYIVDLKDKISVIGN